MGTTGYLRGLMAVVLAISACQSASAPEPQSESVPATAMDTQPEPASPANKSHNNKHSNRDVSALKRQPALSQNCTATAYVGTVNAATVRQGPSNDAPVIGAIAPQESVVVTGQNAAWLSVTPGPEAAGELAGWVQSDRLAIQVYGADPSGPDGTVPLYAAPDPAAATPSGVVTGTEVSLLGCSGGWLQVQDSESQPGWLAPEHQCSNPLSACP
jgi:uncharacterized protein YgiM (DUF1202 family)